MAGIIFNAILSYVIIRNQDIPDKKRLANILNHITVILMTTNVIFLICSFNIWINNLELILCFNWLVYMSFIDRHTGLVYEFMEYYGIIPVISGLIRIVVGKYNTGNKESLFVILLFISVLYYILYIWGIYGEGDADVFIIVGIVLSLYTAYNNEIVAASLDGEATLKTLKLNGEAPMLVPANPKYSEIYLEGKEVSILGVAIGVIKNKLN